MSRIFLKKVALAVFLLQTICLGAWAGIGAGARALAGAEESKKITLVYFADSHAQIDEHIELFWKEDGSAEELALAGGYPRMHAAALALRAENPDGFLFMDAGDTIQGSGPAVLSKGQALVPILNKMQIDMAIPGNWEVVYGVDVLKGFASKINYPLIAANVFDEKTGKLIFEPYKIFEKKGIKIAIIGYTDPDVPLRQPPSYSKGFTYKGDEVLQPIVNEIRKNKKADLIVLLTHIGLPKAVELSSRIKDVDLHLSGDTHERTYTPIVKNHWVVEPGSFASFLGKIELTVKNNKVTDKKWELIELRADKFKEDTELKKIADLVQKPYKKTLNKIIGQAKDPIFRYEVNQTSMDMMLADAIKEATGADIGLSNGFRFASPIAPGPIFEKDLHLIYPINNQLRSGEVTGAQLLEWWEKEIENVYSADARKLFGGWLPRPSGMTLRFKAGAPAGKRVQEILVGGRPLKLDKVYTVAACVREGDPVNKVCRIPNIKNSKDYKVDAHGAVRNYLKKHGPVTSNGQIRVIAEDLPTVIRSQYYRK